MGNKLMKIFICKSYLNKDKQDETEYGPEENEPFIQLPLIPDDAKNIYMAKYDYSSHDEKYISFKRGDMFEILDDKTQKWWRARCLKTGSERLIPSNYFQQYNSLERYDWYFGKIARDIAECLLLRNGRPGTFIIRESEGRPGNFSLSLRDNGSIKHYKIDKLDIGGYAISGNKKRKTNFADLAALVQHHKRSANGLPLKLEQACPKLGNDHWETSREQVQLMKVLGKGQFGEVHEGKWNGDLLVAVKILRSKDETAVGTFLEEANMMKKFCHKHLVQLYAVVSAEEPCIIMELMSKGCLNKYLKSTEGQKLELAELVNISAAVADGLSYLEKLSVVHRDVAARNVLVGQENQVKLADFGLSRFCKHGSYFKSELESVKLPIKWTAPEAILQKVFSTKTDVWSFGILLYEIITKGKVPYPGQSHDDVLQSVINGCVMSSPADCPKKFYDIMLACWKMEPEQRPKFEILTWQLKEFFVLTENEFKETPEL